VAKAIVHDGSMSIEGILETASRKRGILSTKEFSMLTGLAVHEDTSFT